MMQAPDSSSRTGAKTLDRPLTVLGLETSCDETAAAVVRLDADGRVEVLADEIARQDEEHAPYGGVVPEIAARAHAQKLDAVVARAMAAAGLDFEDLDGVAATAGPGLVGGVMVALMTGKAIALAHDLPLVAVNHLEGHALSPRLSGDLAFPYLLLLVSGGHTQLLVVEDVGRSRRLGSTIDDAAGEAFDKLAKIMGLGVPGGPALERTAASGDPTRFELPRPLLRTAQPDFSFAGLKTAARRAWESLEAPTERDRADLAASFQAAAVEVIADRARRALTLAGPVTALVAAGGVAANTAIRTALKGVAAEAQIPLIAPPLRWCTDNAAMIALAGGLRLQRGERDDLAVPARPRWPLDAEAAETAPAVGGGFKGPKA
jgi:N6-L-threonylcarbamoyladenine synthase